MKVHGITIDPTRDRLVTEQAKQLLERFYTSGKEGSYQKAIATVANCFSLGDQALAQRIYDYISQGWFYPSSPIFSNAVDGKWIQEVSFENGTSNLEACWDGKAPRAMPIACFLAYLEDSINGQVETASELSHLSVLGGGTAVHSRIRATSDKAPGPIPYIKTLDGVMGYYRQGKTRRGSTAVYLDISHPDIEEFILMRHPSGGDHARKIDNRKGVHLAVNITKAFREAVDADAQWDLVCPHTKNKIKSVGARTLWEALLDARELTGEPFLYFVDVANASLPDSQVQLGLKNYGSNLCTEITLATSADRTAVCCLSSLNLDKYDSWKDSNIVEDLVRFLDNVLEWFITFAPKTLKRAVASAKAERAIGIGFMGWHYYLMQKGIPYESGGFNSAIQEINRIHRECLVRARAESESLGRTRGEAPDMVGTGRRNSHLFAIAPNVNSAVLCGTSPSCEPINSNAYTQKSRAGISLVTNPYLQKWWETEGWVIAKEKNIPLDNISFWKEVIVNNGSIQHLDFIPEHTRKVFKTAWEIDQHWVVEHAEQRQRYICQAQSTNLFFLPGTERSYINSVHLKAMRGEQLKSLYYFRTGSAQAADVVQKIERKPLEDWKGTGDECIACQG